MDFLPRAAIAAEKRLVDLIYFDQRLVVEPHDYGVHNGMVKPPVSRGRLEQLMQST